MQCKVESVECKRTVWSVECDLQRERCGLQSVELKGWDVRLDCRMLDLECKVWNVKR